MIASVANSHDRSLVYSRTTCGCEDISEGSYIPSARSGAACLNTKERSAIRHRIPLVPPPPTPTPAAKHRSTPEQCTTPHASNRQAMVSFRIDGFMSVPTLACHTPPSSNTFQIDRKRGVCCYKQQNLLVVRPKIRDAAIF